MGKNKILVILGPTASGKSDLGVQLAKKFNGEVISADSRQVYKGLDVGTGKITEEEMQGIPHHLLDVVGTKTRFSVSSFQKLAFKKIDEILSRGKLPIIVGGTGFYIQSIVDGTVLPEVSPNEKLRKALSKKSPSVLFSMLKKIDPSRAENVDPKNSRRIIRAIEIAKSLGKVPKVENRLSAKYVFLQIGIETEPKKLRDKINIRLFVRIRECGMIEEAEKLHKKGLTWKRMNELGLEYRYLAEYLQKKMSKEEMLEKLGFEIWHYAKRQMTWFKRDSRIKWFDLKSTGKIRTEVSKFLKV